MSERGESRRVPKTLPDFQQHFPNEEACIAHLSAKRWGLWPGIDLVFSGTVNRLKHELVVWPGAVSAERRPDLFDQVDEAEGREQRDRDRR